MKSVRLVLRLTGAVGATLGLWLVWVLGLPVAALAGRFVAWRAWVLHLWARSLTRILGVRVSQSGSTPEGAFLLVSNHLSYVDIILLGGLARCVFVSKAEVARWPVLGPLARTMGTLFIDRTKKRDVVRIASEIRARLDAGQGVVFFPEGTSTPGAEVAAFRSSLLEPAAALDLPVYYASLSYATPAGEAPAAEVVSWWGDMPFAPHLLELLRLPYIEARVSFGEQPIRANCRKDLAQKLHQAVSSRFVPMPTRTSP